MPSPAQQAAHDRLERLGAPYLARPGVDWGRMFGTIGLRVRGKIFAVAAHGGGLMVKIPATRAAELVDAGEVVPVVIAGRQMREWMLVPDAASDESWAAILDEAHRYLDEITPR